MTGMHKVFVLFITTLLILFVGCTSRKGASQPVAELVDFGNVQTCKSSDLIRIERFLPLETSDSSLFGTIDQLEVWKDRIYLLDTYKTNAVLVFSATDGKFIHKIEGTGNGPGEFLSPHSFWIDRSDSSLYVMDRMMSKLLKYDLTTFEYEEDIKLPGQAPLAFCVPAEGDYLYYFPLRQNDPFSGKQYVEADKEGNVLSTAYDAPASGRILHGHTAPFYGYEGKIRVYPYFSNRIYEWTNDSLKVCLEMKWGDRTFPEAAVFEKAEDSGDVMRELLSDDYIRFLYVYENRAALAVKYYVQKDLYLSVYNKSSGRVANVKAADVQDDLGLGGLFPMPVGTDGDLLVGSLSLLDMEEKITSPELKACLNQADEEGNPVLVFYDLN